MVASISTNNIKSRKAKETTAALQRAKQALFGYSAVQAVKGSLPCPDTDNPRDGRENRIAGVCQATLGGLPYRDLSTDDLRDASAAQLWYAVDPIYSDANNLIARNSSVNGSYSLNGTSVAALVIAPGATLDGQQRDNVVTANYLEGENANTSINTYAQTTNAANNDLIQGLETAAYWHLNEQATLREASDLLLAYRSACGEYPWAADFTLAADDSIANLQQGSFPLNSALPINWNTGCASGLLPSAALADHWSDQIYYAFCLNAEANCLSIIGDRVGNAAAVLIAPGTQLATQNRGNYMLAEYFEAENASGTRLFRWIAPKNINGNFNDYLHIVSP